MRRMLTGVTGLVLVALLFGSNAAAAAPNVRPAPPVPATAAQPPALKAPAALPGGASGQLSAAAASAAPVFQNYLQCFSGYIYTDFSDPDGDDTKLNVQVWAMQKSTSTYAVTWLMNSGAGAHGVYWWLNSVDVNFNTNNVSYYYFRAMDQTGTWSAWTYATGKADGSCKL